MNLWNVEDLYLRLEGEAVSQEEKFQYLFWTSVSTSAAIWMIAWFGQITSFLGHLEFGLGLLLTIVGSLYARKKYKPNGLLVERAICLSLPIIIRMIVFTIPFHTVVVCLEEFGFIPIDTGLSTVATLAGDAYFFQRLSFYLGRFQGQK